ncbi:MAG: PadR family transcriptional regulator [Planctomycetota bacterium]
MLDLSTCPCAGNTLDRLVQPAILTLLAGGPLHGYLLAAQMAERFTIGDQKPDMSGVYRFLKSMEEKGLVASSWDLSHGGPARKCYEITADGRHCLAQWIETLERYRDGINCLLRAARSALRTCAGD